MKGTNYLLAVTTTTDEITNEIKPLFAFPVQVCKASQDNSVRFEVAAPSGVKREQKWLDPATGEIVTNDECPRGVFVGDEFRPIDKEQIDAINAEEKLTTMVVQGRVSLPHVREKYADRITGRYYLQNPAKGGSAKSYRLLFEALRDTEKGQPAQALIVKRTKSTKQALGFIYADESEQCLVLCEVLFAAQVREADEQVRQPTTVGIEAKQVQMARKVIAGMNDGELTLANELDEADLRKRELIEAAIAGEALPLPTPVANTVETDDIEAMLEKSLGA